MIKIEVNKGEVDSYINGSLSEICADCITVIHAVYNQIKAEDEESAEEFKHIMSKHMSLSFNTEDEVCEEIRRRDEEKKEHVKEVFLKMAGMLDNGKSIEDVTEFLKEVIKNEVQHFAD